METATATMRAGNALGALWKTPRAPDAPARVWRDWALVVVCVGLMIAEWLAKPALVWPAPTIAVGIVLAFALLWRRTRPLLVVCGAFGATAVMEIAGVVQGVDWEGLDSFACLLVLPYALARWGSGSERSIGALVIAASFGIGMWADHAGWGAIAGASLFLMFPAALGASVRYQDGARRREREQVRLRERSELARELHDSVAHHVSAIAIQAQAGRALAATRPEAATQALATIEEAAARALEEMRSMVGALRDDAAAERAPRPGLDDVDRLIDERSGMLAVVVERQGDLAALPPAIDTTLYRIARESVTNAVRHAAGAERVLVRITGDRERVSMTVRDDGSGAGNPSADGFGLRGMKERVTLLGGTFDAGPVDGGGWQVEATLPRGGNAGSV